MSQRKLEPLEVYAVDEKMNRCTGSIPYKSLRWVRRYKEPGEFEMVVPADVFDPEWAFICCDNRPETGIVQKVAYTDDAQTYAGVDSVTVSGFFLESILNNIVFLAESPETEKVYVPKPRRPVVKKTASPTVYTDAIGGWYVDIGGGKMRDVKTGKVYSSENMEPVKYKQHISIANPGNDDYGYSRFAYHESDGKIVRVGFDGTVSKYLPEFEYGGNVFYYDEHKKLCQAQGVADSRADSYFVKKQQWDLLDKEDIYGKYYEQTVKGPWQRTEALEPVTEGDSVDIVFRWARRMMGDWIFYAEPEIKGVVRKVDPSFKYLGDLLYETLYEVGASLRFEYLFEYNQYILSAYRGKDRTQGQSSNPWAVFSDTWGTLRGFEAFRDESNYKNTCFTLYEYDRPQEFDADGWPVAKKIYRLGEGPDSSTGLTDGLPTAFGVRFDRKRGYLTDKIGGPDDVAAETYLDLRDEKPSCDKDWKHDPVELPQTSREANDKALAQAEKEYEEHKKANLFDMEAVYVAFEADLKTRGTAYLKEKYPVIVEVDTGEPSLYSYLRDWDLGDVVDMSVSTVGLKKTGRVVEVVEEYDGSGSNVSMTIDEDQARTEGGGA